MNTRIEGTDTMTEVVTKMAGGNPDALTVCVNILERGGEIYHDGALGGLDALLSLDILEIYEHRIWMLYKDVCDENLPTMLAVIRACRIGILDVNALNTAIDNCGRGIDLHEIVRQVEDHMSAFNIGA